MYGNLYKIRWIYYNLICAKLFGHSFYSVEPRDTQGRVSNCILGPGSSQNKAASEKSFTQISPDIYQVWSVFGVCPMGVWGHTLARWRTDSKVAPSVRSQSSCVLSNKITGYKKTTIQMVALSDQGHDKNLHKQLIDRLFSRSFDAQMTIYRY